MVMCDLAMFPVGEGMSLSPYVARILRIIHASGIAYRLTPMGTILEGSWDEVMLVVGECFHELRRDCARISVSMNIDYRDGDTPRLEEKVLAVKRKSGTDLRT